MSKGKMNVLMLCIDALRFDCVGYQPDKNRLEQGGVSATIRTPTFDSLASGSARFTQAISASTYTTASNATILTGLYPPRHGIRAFYDTKLSDSARTLPEVFKAKGFTTVLATDVKELWEPLGLARGFDSIIERNDAALFDFIEKKRGEKLFLFAHFFDVHPPTSFPKRHPLGITIPITFPSCPN
jgi:hypothetical protein